MQRDPLRIWISKNLQTLTFLGAYLITTVAGNLIYASPLAEQSVRGSGYRLEFLQFPHTFTVGFWLLLLCPFVLTPLIVWATRRMAAGRADRFAQLLPEFSRSAYLSIAAACVGFVLYRFWVADVANLFASGVDAGSSVQARFTIRDRIGYITFVPLQALLPFLVIYALIRSMKSREVFWAACTLIGTVVLSVVLIMINMKWPVLLFYVGLVLAIFVYSHSRPYLKTAMGAFFLFVGFMLMSTWVFRLAHAPQISRSAASATSRPAAGSVHTPAKPRAADEVPVSPSALSEASDQVVATGKAARLFAPTILIVALNRMAISYPYYYQIATEEGAVCGGLMAQARRDPSCRPSTLVYQRIHTTDRFRYRGTSPIAAHISSYALGGWPLAMVALVAASVILGLFAALPLDGGGVSRTGVILGALTGYHLSQVPGEGAIFYEHGLIWPVLLIAGYGLWHRLTPARNSKTSS